MSYAKTFEVRWADLDPNFHMRHTAYGDYAAHVRFSCLNDFGFSLERFGKLQIGPVLFSEKTDYFRELRAGDRITVNVLLAGMNEDGRKWRVQHEITKEGGVKSALVTVDGAWLHTGERKVVVPPPELIETMNRMPRAAAFQVLP